MVPTPILADFGKRPSDRMFVLAIDEASLKPGDAMVAAQAGRKFIDTLHESDYIGLYKFPVIERQLDLTHGHAAVKIALGRISGSFLHMRGEFNLTPSEIVDITATDHEVWQQVVRRECDPVDLELSGSRHQRSADHRELREADAASARALAAAPARRAGDGRRAQDTGRRQRRDVLVRPDQRTARTSTR